MPIEMIEEFDQGTRIKVVGVGGGGGQSCEGQGGEKLAGGFHESPFRGWKKLGPCTLS